MSDPALSLATLELKLRSLLPADLYAAVWVEPEPHNLMKVFEHLRTLQRILQDYTPRQVSDDPPCPGKISYRWQEGTLLFTDLAGFTPLLEANAAVGQHGATVLLNVLNGYFSEMIEIISKSGGDLLEFTGDAMLVQFLADASRGDLAQAVRAGLRMQRAMSNFANIETPQGNFSLGMRVGIHAGRFLTADIGTPIRMVHVLLGRSVRRAKRAEAAGQVGRVCLTMETGEHAIGGTTTRFLNEDFRLESLDQSYVLVKDDFTAEQLGEYDITLTRRRHASAFLLDRSVAGLVSEIGEVLKRVEPLASYFPGSILNLLVENAAQRRIPPDFPTPAVVFINLKGLPEAVDGASHQETEGVVASFSRAFAAIDAAVQSRGGILQKVTYHSVGSDFLIYFGVLGRHANDVMRAADTALAIRDIVSKLEPPIVNNRPLEVTCRMGFTLGSVFAAEIGEARGRREFNILGDPVNTAARLMTYATPNQILLTKDVYEYIGDRYDCETLGEVALKGKSSSVPVFALTAEREAD
ncbi:MAG: adenylate/guanylate cyclase domain-containing protein [Oculatellaceae cyanobacterium bins.114]|nr:adenylate/guanylate cyclase domain-containing protein [Oculatellaceae cyanobacterium bins.114]